MKWVGKNVNQCSPLSRVSYLANCFCCDCTNDSNSRVDFSISDAPPRLQIHRRLQETHANSARLTQIQLVGNEMEVPHECCMNVCMFVVMFRYSSFLFVNENVYRVAYNVISAQLSSSFATLRKRRINSLSFCRRFERVSDSISASLECQRKLYGFSTVSHCQ